MRLRARDAYVRWVRHWRPSPGGDIRQSLVHSVEDLPAPTPTFTPGNKKSHRARGQVGRHCHFFAQLCATDMIAYKRDKSSLIYRRQN